MVHGNTAKLFLRTSKTYKLTLLWWKSKYYIIELGLIAVQTDF